MVTARRRCAPRAPIQCLSLVQTGQGTADASDKAVDNAVGLACRGNARGTSASGGHAHKQEVLVLLRSMRSVKCMLS